VYIWTLWMTTIYRTKSIWCVACCIDEHKRFPCINGLYVVHFWTASFFLNVFCQIQIFHIQLLQIQPKPKRVFPRHRSPFSVAILASHPWVDCCWVFLLENAKKIILPYILYSRPPPGSIFSCDQSSNFKYHTKRWSPETLILA
jgi:hypothetical protein